MTRDIHFSVKIMLPDLGDNIRTTYKLRMHVLMKEYTSRKRSCLLSGMCGCELSYHTIVVLVREMCCHAECTFIFIFIHNRQQKAACVVVG